MVCKNESYEERRSIHKTRKTQSGYFLFQANSMVECAERHTEYWKNKFVQATVLTQSKCIYTGKSKQFIV